MQVTRQGAVVVMRIDEAVNHDNSPKIREQIIAAIPKGQPRVVIDLKNMPLCDSVGLELLLDIRDLCLRAGGLMKLASASHLIRDILSVTGLTEQIELYENEVAAMGSFAT